MLSLVSMHIGGIDLRVIKLQLKAVEPITSRRPQTSYTQHYKLLDATIKVIR